MEHFVDHEVIIASETLAHEFLRKTRDNSVKLSQNGMQIIFDTIPAYVYVKDLHDKYIYVNKALADSTGIPQSDWIGKSSPELFHDFADEYIKGDDEVISKGLAVHNDVKVYSSNNGIVWTHTDKLPFKDENGNIIGIIGISHDITERKKMEESLEKSERRFREILENIRLIAVIVDKSGIVTFCNDFFLELTGWDRDEVLGKNWFMTFFPKTEPEDMRLHYLKNIAKDEVPRHYTSSLLTKSGDEKMISWNSTPVNDHNNNVIGLTSIGEDITDRHHYEEGLKKLNADKDKFFSIIAHDLKSPFTALLGFSEYLANYLDELSEEEIRDFAININKSATGVFRLIENLLQWSRFQLGRMEFAPSNFSFNELAEEIRQLYRANAIRKNLRLETELQPGLIAFADRNMIDTVLRNIISNSIKFTNSGGKITLTACSCSDCIEVSVTDNGIGISPDNVEKLFKIGEKLTTKGTDHEMGTGLGLKLCKEFIEKNGGCITVVTKAGEGSRFTFTIPQKH